MFMQAMLIVFVPVVVCSISKLVSIRVVWPMGTAEIAAQGLKPRYAIRNCVVIKAVIGMKAKHIQR